MLTRKATEKRLTDRIYAGNNCNCYNLSLFVLPGWRHLRAIQFVKHVDSVMMKSDSFVTITAID